MRKIIFFNEQLDNILKVLGKYYIRVTNSMTQSLPERTQIIQIKDKIKSYSAHLQLIFYPFMLKRGSTYDFSKLVSVGNQGDTFLSA